MGYLSSEVVGKEMNTFIPECLRYTHDKIIYNLTRNDNVKISNPVYRHGWARCAEGFITPAQLSVFFHLSEEKGLIYVALFKALDFSSIEVLNT